MLKSIKAMYSGVKARVKTAPGEVTDAFDVCSGVKQGCPLSPTIFGLFIDHFEEVVARECPEVGALLHNKRVRLLMYADDIVLISEDEFGLQQLLKSLEGFCTDFKLQVNMNKTEVVVFRKS